MTYGWEEKAREAICPLLDEVIDDMPGNFELVGIAVSNADTGEAAFWNIYSNTGVYMADVAGDVMGDAIANYQDAVKNIHRGGA
jgi:hypothetical protein